MKENISFNKYKNSAKLKSKKVFPKEMYDPKQQLTFFDFNYADKYKQFLCETFYLNKEVLNHTMAGVIIGFGPDNIKKIGCSVKNILNELKRKYIFIEAGGKTFIQCVKYHTGKYCVTNSDALSILENIMLNTDTVVVFNEFSKCKIRGDKESLMRCIIKIGDRKENPVPDLIFIDYAVFYHKSKSLLSPYIRCIG
jgi:hypothetical protein